MGLFSAIFAKRPGGSPFGNLLRGVAGSIPGVGGIVKAVLPPAPPQETAADKILKEMKDNGQLGNLSGGGAGGYRPPADLTMNQGIGKSLDTPADGGGNKVMDWLKAKWYWVAGGLVLLVGGWFMLKPKKYGGRRR